MQDSPGLTNKWRIGMSNKTATDVKSVKKDVISRRKFMRGTAVAGVAAGTFAAPHIATAATVL